MRVLNLLVTGNPGGIETLCKSIAFSRNTTDNRWLYVFSGGIIADEMKKKIPEKVEILNEKYNFIKIVKYITNYCKKNKIDIIVLHHDGLYTNMLYLLIKIFNKKIKYVKYLHSCYTYTNIIEKIILKKSLVLSDKVFCVSNAVYKSYINGLNIPDDNFKVIYNGINNSFYSTKNVEKIKYDLIYVGRLEKEKGVDLLIDSISKIVDKNYDIKVAIVGDGSELPILKQKVKKFDLVDNVSFLGKKLNVIEYLDQSKLFIYPSICEEAFGLSVVEAMARKVVPITFNTGGLSEIINNEKNGFLVDKIDSESLTNKIEEVLNISNLDKIRDNAYDTSLNFSVENTIKNINNEYNIKKEKNRYGKK